MKLIDLDSRLKGDDNERISGSEPVEVVMLLLFNISVILLKIEWVEYEFILEVDDSQ